MTQRSHYRTELEEELTDAGSTRAAMRVRRNMVGKEPTQEELERWDLTPEVLAKLAEVDSEPTEEKEQQKQELSEEMKKLFIRLDRKSPKIPGSVWQNQYAAKQQLDPDTKAAIVDKVDHHYCSEEWMTQIGTYLSDTMSVGQMQQNLVKFGVACANHSRAELIALLAVKIIWEASNSPAGEMYHLADLVMNLSRAEVVDAAAKAGVDQSGSKATVTVRLVEAIYQDILKPEGA